MTANSMGSAIARDAPAVPLGGIAKRGFDIVAASFALLLLSPLFLLLAALVKVSDGGAVLYGHPRIGRDGQPFRCLKFRTMVQNGDEVLANYLRAHPAARAEWQATRKLRDDPRVTPLGRVLRRLSLDELPQIINILRGEMSTVGPRPVIRAELDAYGSAAPFYLRTRPGLTGLWQVSGRNDVSYDIRIAFDRLYVENWSLYEDVRIILLTVSAVCTARGSY